MGIIEIINDLTTKNVYRCKDKKSNFVMFATLLYSNNVQFSNKVTNNVWLGNFVDSSNQTFMVQNNIKVIVNCSKDLPFYFTTQEVPYQYRIPVDDNLEAEEIRNLELWSFEIVFKIMREYKKGGPILVHCAAGMQRSAACTAMCWRWTPR